MKRLLFIILFPITLMAQDTVWVVGSMPGSASGEFKKIIIGADTRIVTGSGTYILPSGGAPDTSAAGKFISKEQTRTGYAATSHTQAQSTVTGLTDSVAAKPTRAELTALLATKETALGIQDTSSFTTTATRKAIYLAGCRQTWQFWVATRKNGLPVAGDQLAYWTKTDSLIVFRAVGTTSGQRFGYGREK